MECLAADRQRRESSEQSRVDAGVVVEQRGRQEQTGDRLVGDPLLESFVAQQVFGLDDDDRRAIA